jgi:hypothetical protein
MLTLLIVTVFSVGGPPGTPDRPLRNAQVTVSQEPHSPPPLSARTGRSGRVSWRLRAGAYSVRAFLVPPQVTPGRPCQGKAFTLGTKTQRVTLVCSIL